MKTRPLCLYFAWYYALCLWKGFAQYSVDKTLTGKNPSKELRPTCRHAGVSLLCRHWILISYCERVFWRDNTCTPWTFPIPICLAGRFDYLIYRISQSFPSRRLHKPEAYASERVMVLREWEMVFPPQEDRISETYLGVAENRVYGLSSWAPFMRENNYGSNRQDVSFTDVNYWQWP